MLGWMILFALMAIAGAIRILVDPAAGASVAMACVLFTALFLAGLLTRAARGRAW